MKVIARHYGIITSVEQEYMSYWKLRNAYMMVNLWLFVLTFCMVCRWLFPQFSEAERPHGTSQTNWYLYSVHHDEACGVDYKNIRLPMMGRHQVLNATAVQSLAYERGIPGEIILYAFLGFIDTLKRREVREIVCDDYVHHSTEIAAALKEAIPGCYIRVYS